MEIGHGWHDMETAPQTGTILWLTDGSLVAKAWWSEDVHGLPGWRDEVSFAHFRTYRPQGWQPFHKPKAPRWPVEKIAPLDVES